MKYRSEQPVKRYIYNHTHYHRAIADLVESAKNKESIQDKDLKAILDPANETHVIMFEAGQACESQLLCISALISRLPEYIGHKFDDGRSQS